MTSEMISHAQAAVNDLFAAIDNHTSSDILIMHINALDYYLDRAASEALGDESVLEIRDKSLERKRTRIADLEDELQNCYKALDDMSNRCEKHMIAGQNLKTDLKNATETVTDLQNKLTIAEDECHFLKQALDAVRSDLETRKKTIEELYMENDTLRQKTAGLESSSAQSDNIEFGEHFTRYINPDHCNNLFSVMNSIDAYDPDPANSYDVLSYETGEVLAQRKEGMVWEVC